MDGGNGPVNSGMPRKKNHFGLGKAGFDGFKKLYPVYMRHAYIGQNDMKGMGFHAGETFPRIFEALDAVSVSGQNTGDLLYGNGLIINHGYRQAVRLFHPVRHIYSQKTGVRRHPVAEPG